MPGPLSQTVDGALDLTGPGFDAGEAVGDGQTEVIVAVGADDGPIDVGDVFLEVGDDLAEVVGGGVADGIGDVDGGGPGVDGFLDDFAEEVEFGACGVFWGEFDIGGGDVAAGGHFVAGVADHLDRASDDLLLGHFELEFPMNRAGRQEHVNPNVLRIAQCIPGAVNIFLTTTGQTAYGCPITISLGNFVNGVEVPRRGDGEPGFEDVDPQFDQRPGDFEFFLCVHTAAGRLLTVAEGCVENRDGVGRHPRGLPRKAQSVET